MSKIGLFGGSFNPIHMGHINSMLTVADYMELQTIKVIPSNVTPLKETTQEEPTPQQRKVMVELAIQEYPEVLELDEIELSRSGVSFSIDTIKEYLKTYSPSDLYLIIGADQFEQFDQWKDFEKILESVNLVVTTRPGSYLPFVLGDFPEGIRSLIEDFDQNMTVLKTGREIHFVRLNDKDISATEIRKRLRSGRNVSDCLDAHVEKYLTEEKIYNSVGHKIGDYKQFTEYCRNFLNGKKALNVLSYDLSSLDMPSEYTLIAAGTSTRHTQSLAENLVRSVKDEYGVFPYGIEGKGDGRWILIDYGALIVHVFYDYVRAEYRLEDLWTSRGAKPF